jgi:hypothetical protein
MLLRLLVTRTKGGKIRPRLLETQRSVGSAPNASGILVVLAVVLPETDRTDFISTSFSQGQESTARASVPNAGLWWANNRIRSQLPDVVIEPLLSRIDIRRRLRSVGHVSESG